MGFPTAADIVSNPSDLKELFGLNPCLIGDLAVDLAITYASPRSATITERPVEQGFDVTDARNIQPQEVTMDCIFTDPDVSGSNIGKQALNGTLRQSLTTSWREKRDRLYEIFNSEELITVSTPEEEHRNMVITEILPDRQASTANAFFCTVRFREIRLVSSENVSVDPSQIPKKLQEKETSEQKTVREKKAAPEKDLGQRSTQTATEQEKGVAAGFGDTVAGFFGLY